MIQFSTMIVEVLFFSSELSVPAAQWLQELIAGLGWNDMRNENKLASLMIKTRIDDKKRQKT